LSFVPRLRQACRPTRKGSASTGPAPAAVDLTLPDPEEEANVALLSGTIVEEPVRDKSRDGDPITVLLIAFDAPDEKARRAAACCEVEIPDEIAERQRGRLRAGRRLVVLGQLTGAGGLWATAILTRESTRPAQP
jgi:hypothetical protein